MTKTTTIQFATAAQAWARVNQLESLLGLPLSAEEQFIEKAWSRIEELELQLAAKPASTPPTKPANAAKVELPPFVDPLKHVAKDELRGIARAAAANAEGRTAKRTPTGDGMPTTGWGKAARAQAQRNADRKPQA